jgi:gluconate 2-dehydrogenase gamma chain
LSTPALTRRELLAYSLASSAAVLRAAHGGLAATLFAAAERALVAQPQAAGLTALTPSEAAELGAIAARIIPSDDTPGATEAGAIVFIDRVLGGSRAEFLPRVREGLGSLLESAKAAHGTAFSALTAPQQDTLLRQIETSPFFALLRYLTICGTFALPDYGGNRNHVGWNLVGFDHRHAWQPPFGFYDADYAAKGE